MYVKQPALRAISNNAENESLRLKYTFSEFKNKRRQRSVVRLRLGISSLLIIATSS